MDGIHDLGGMEGFGPIPIEANEPVFHAEWEARVMALRMLMSFWRKWSVDAGRHSVEKLPPADYLGLSYYEKWLASLLNLSVDAGLLTSEEIASGRPAQSAEKRSPAVDAAGAREFLSRGRPTLRDIEAPPQFAIGERVCALDHMHSGHHRLPRYARGRVGEIILHHGAHVLPDTNAARAGENPQHLYTVCFAARELWGDEAAPRDTVTVDLWESYLAPA